MLDLTADTKVDENHNKLDKTSEKILPPLEIQFGDVQTKTKIITYWLKIACITIVMIIVLAK